MAAALDQIPESLWKVAVRRERIIAPLARREHVTIQQVEQAAKKLDLGTAMVFRLVARYRRQRRTSALIPERRGRKPGIHVLETKQEKLIKTVIEDIYLRPERPTIAALHREVRLASRQNTVSEPSYQTVRRRVLELDQRTLLEKRLGAKEAAQLLSPVQQGLQVSAPLELVQIDHTLVDVIVVDEIDREPIGRPWLTLAIDVATRMQTNPSSEKLPSEITAINKAYRDVLLSITSNSTLLGHVTSPQFQSFVDDILELLERQNHRQQMRCGKRWQNTSVSGQPRLSAIVVVDLILNAIPAADRQTRCNRHRRSLKLWTKILSSVPENEVRALKQSSRCWPAAIRGRFDHAWANHERTKPWWRTDPSTFRF